MMKTKAHIKQEIHQEAGFTLLGVLIGLVVLSILMTPLFMSQKREQESEAHKATFSEVAVIESALIKFGQENQRYPVPAAPQLAMRDIAGAPNALFGAEGFSRDALGDELLSATGDRAGYVAGVLQTNPANPINVIIGAVPTNALGLPPQAGLDQHGRKLTYAVTEVLTLPNRLIPNDNQGAITLQNQSVIPALVAGLPIPLASSANPVPANHIHAPGGNVQFVVIGHGENGNGTYLASGGVQLACPIGVLERENCDNDATFVALEDDSVKSDPVTGALTVSHRTTLPVESFVLGGGGPAQLDDSIAARTSLFQDGDWSYIGSGTGPLAVDGSVAETTMVMGRGIGSAQGRVGIGIGNNTDAAALLHVAGTMETGTIRTPKLCNTTQSNCYNVLDIAERLEDTDADGIIDTSPPLFCGPRTGLRAISAQNQVNARQGGSARKECDTITNFIGDFETGACPPGQFARSISVDASGSLMLVCGI